MTWLQRYRVRHYIHNAIWFWPVVTMLATLLGVRLLHALEEAMGWEARLNPDTVRTVLGALAGAMFTFIVFVCSSLLLIVQLATAQLTPRVIGSMFRGRVVKLSLSVFVFAFVFSLSAMIRVTTVVPLVSTYVATYSCVASIGVFLYLVDYAGKALRPSGVFGAAALEAHAVINQIYPQHLGETDSPDAPAPSIADARPVRTIVCSTGGVVLAFDVAGLVALGTSYDCLIELAPQVGNFVAPGDPLFHVRGGADVPEQAFHDSIALGAERTMEQDPAFGFRLIVDIASKGLSPAINDPTTAVLALDRIHHLLRHVGRRRLDNASVADRSGRVRLIYRTADWEDFVVLAVTEIRQFGGSSIQVARRLRAMLENLLTTLPALRAEPLKRELRLLKQSTDRFFHEDDRTLANQSDSQGVGGAEASH